MILPNHDILVIDVETSGLDANKHSMLSLGACLLDQHLRIKFTKYYLIKPQQPYIYDPKALEINGFRNNDFKTHEPLPAVIQQFHTVFGQQQSSPLLAGWNAHFDVSFLKKAYAISGLKWTFGHRYLDVFGISFFLTGENRSLVDYLQQYNRIVTHNALQDAVDTAFLLQKFYNLSGLN